MRIKSIAELINGCTFLQRQYGPGQYRVAITRSHTWHYSSNSLPSGFKNDHDCRFVWAWCRPCSRRVQKVLVNSLRYESSRFFFHNLEKHGSVRMNDFPEIAPLACPVLSWTKYNNIKNAFWRTLGPPCNFMPMSSKHSRILFFLFVIIRKLVWL